MLDIHQNRLEQFALVGEDDEGHLWLEHELEDQLALLSQHQLRNNQGQQQQSVSIGDPKPETPQNDLFLGFSSLLGPNTDSVSEALVICGALLAFFLAPSLFF